CVLFRSADLLEAQEVKTKKLNVSHAFHSPLMEPMLADFERIAREITYSLPRIDLISNLAGKLATAQIATPEYWCRHIRQPVRFAESMETLAQQGYEVFVECGPKPTLLGMGRQCLKEGTAVWLPSLRQGQSEWQEILQSLGELYVRGVRVDWSGFDRDYARRLVQLPTYPFQRKRYWVDIAKNDHLKADNLSQETVQTPIMNLISLEDTQQLVQHLETTEELSEDELKVLPKLLKILVKQNQQQVVAASIKDWF
ncbi:MAG: acyltransferase domain-containing protein, partial [Microcoleus sp. SIO2G3]|nr:acyltransferase domain-containing protein [Microcoleus sp. SIO2G3]